MPETYPVVDPNDAITATTVNGGDEVAWGADTEACTPSLSNIQHFGSYNPTDEGSRGIFVYPSGEYFVTWRDQGTTHNEAVIRHQMSTPFDITTASLDTENENPVQESDFVEFVRAVHMKPDLTDLYISHAGATPLIHQSSVSPAGDISSGNLTKVADFDPTTELPSNGDNHRGLHFRDDGVRWWIAVPGNTAVYEMEMSTQWDISTSSYTGTSVDIGSDINGSIRGLTFSSDLEYLLISDWDGSNQWFNEYTMTTPGDISTTSFENRVSVIAEGAMHLTDANCSLFVEEFEQFTF